MVAAAIDRWWDPEKQQGLQDMCAAAPSCTSKLCNAAFPIFVKGFIGALIGHIQCLSHRGRSCRPCALSKYPALC